MVLVLSFYNYEEILPISSTYTPLDRIVVMIKNVAFFRNCYLVARQLLPSAIAMHSPQVADLVTTLLFSFLKKSQIFCELSFFIATFSSCLGF